MVAVKLSSGIGKMRQDFKKFEKDTMITIHRNAMLDAAYRTQRVLRLRSYPAAFPKARNKQHAKEVTVIGRPGGRSAPRKDTVKKLIQADLKRKREVRLAIYDRTGKNNFGTDYMVRHAFGGIKTPIDGSNIAVPLDYIQGRKGVRGVRQNLRPEQVLQKRKRGGKPGFITKIKGKNIIARREGKTWDGKTRLPITPLYTLVPSVRITRSFRFYEDARVYHKLFDAAYAREYNFRAPKALRRRYSA